MPEVISMMTGWRHATISQVSLLALACLKREGFSLERPSCSFMPDGNRGAGCPPSSKAPVWAQLGSAIGLVLHCTQAAGCMPAMPAGLARPSTGNAAACTTASSSNLARWQACWQGAHHLVVPQSLTKLTLAVLDPGYGALHDLPTGDYLAVVPYTPPEVRQQHLLLAVHAGHGCSHGWAG